MTLGDKMTLGDWRDAWAASAGEGKGTAFLDEKIKAQGRDMPVLADEAQFLHVLAQIEFS